MLSRLSAVLGICLALFFGSFGATDFPHFKRARADGVSAPIAVSPIGSQNAAVQFPPVAASNLITIDGTPQLQAAITVAGSFTLTTANAGDLIVISLSTSAGGTNVTCCTPTTGTGTIGAFTQFGTVTYNTSFWYAVASTALTSKLITFATTSTASGGAIAFSNVNATPFDGSNPSQSVGGAVSITTTNANDMILATVDNGETTADTGFTNRGNVGFFSFETSALTSTASLSLNFNTGYTGHFAAIAIQSQ
jgi:hypothetical protein